ncbi:hypothetical protein BHYA_0403g00010 [Botrytis hyacinthi]|uniref:Uncharacterized protein n=1 Tax=Botrytis hyacinthi TaxID=278943 RepID=A0A4Z1GCQ1_9HELO|nr:hypothetical protein BHYA_0403g00010 [Botrytis hyacinthi]
MFMKLAFHVANLPIMRILGECWVNCDVNLEVPSYRQINTSDIEDIIRSLAFDMVDMDMGGGVLLSSLFQNLASFNGTFRISQFDFSSPHLTITIQLSRESSPDVS